MSLNRRFRSPALSLLLGLLGFSAACLVLLVGSVDPTTSKRFIRTPYFLAWLVMNGIQGGFWAIIAFPLWSWLREVRGGWPTARLDIVFGTLLLVIAVGASNYFFGAYYHPVNLPLDHHLLRVAILNVPGTLIALSAVVGIWLTHGDLRNKWKQSDSNQSEEELAEELATTRLRLRRFLGTAGFVIGLATLSFGVLRNAVLDFEPGRDDFPAISVIVWGVFYSSILALAYAPTHQALSDALAQFAERVVPGGAVTDTGTETAGAKTDVGAVGWLTKRAELLAELTGGQTGWSQFESLFSILAPLMGSVVPVLLGF